MLDNIQCLWSKAQKASEPLLGTKFHLTWKSLLTFPLVFFHSVCAFVPCRVVTMVPGRLFMVNQTKVLMAASGYNKNTNFVWEWEWKFHSTQFINLFLAIHLFLKNVQRQLKLQLQLKCEHCFVVQFKSTVRCKGILSTAIVLLFYPGFVLFLMRSVWSVYCKIKNWDYYIKHKHYYISIKLFVIKEQVQTNVLLFIKMFDVII